jgi:hypothetical protein
MNVYRLGIDLIAEIGYSGDYSIWLWNTEIRWYSGYALFKILYLVFIFTTLSWWTETHGIWHTLIIRKGKEWNIYIDSRNKALINLYRLNWFLCCEVTFFIKGRWYWRRTTYFFQKPPQSVFFFLFTWQKSMTNCNH